MPNARRVALVTGGGRGLGRAHALALSRSMLVVVNDLGGDSEGNQHSSAPAQSVAEEIRAAGGESYPDATDVSDWEAATRLIEWVHERFGRLDVIVNNAGVSRTGLLGGLAEEDWDRQFTVNVKGAVALMNASARRWAESPWAPRAIINTSSPAGPHPMPPIGLYSASKAAVVALTISAAQELAPLGVRVNAIAPIANTRLIDHAPVEVQRTMLLPDGTPRFLPKDAAELVSFLASPECPFTGRLFGSRGDEIYLFSEWSADRCVSSGGKPWNEANLGAALAQLPLQDRRWTMTAAGRVELASPATEILDQFSVGQERPES